MGRGSGSEKWCRAVGALVVDISVDLQESSRDVAVPRRAGYVKRRPRTAVGDLVRSTPLQEKFHDLQVTLPARPNKRGKIFRRAPGLTRANYFQEQLALPHRQVLVGKISDVIS